MRLVLPHTLTKEEVRARLRGHAHELAGDIPADVTTSWTDPDHLALSVRAMGQDLAGEIAIGARELTISLDLPFMLSLMEPMIEGAVREKGTALLA